MPVMSFMDRPTTNAAICSMSWMRLTILRPPLKHSKHGGAALYITKRISLRDPATEAISERPSTRGYLLLVVNMEATIDREFESLEESVLQLKVATTDGEIIRQSGVQEERFRRRNFWESSSALSCR
ncbi:hypothetical protein [Candidatus Reidiella endopervernicosa]|uniref:Uncharacterized protein n=1 Tax=Candidatus Reidiella endopervernicosa TaxID=2738883 RepID=A0A6N0HRZ7_9GAMM|nr:hypothetical protein [Candidatus Reidiella endopervernicosa]QKQ25199.1 hypothetical protein HUE57_02000 [Candidatus Reidiella endopervernicosa]